MKDALSGADIKAMCTEAGLLALRERRMKRFCMKGKQDVLSKECVGHGSAGVRRNEF